MRHRIAIVERGQSEMACPGRPMIQTVAENKYSFNMRVSAAAMAVPDRDRPHQKAAVTQRLLIRPFNQLGCAVTLCLAKMADGILPATSANDRASRFR
jgi:hypothetical protein